VSPKSTVLLFFLKKIIYYIIGSVRLLFIIKLTHNLADITDFHQLIHPHHQPIPSPHWVISGSNVSPNLATPLPSFLTTPIANPSTPTWIRNSFYYSPLSLRLALSTSSSSSHTHSLQHPPLSFTFIYSMQNLRLTRPHATSPLPGCRDALCSPPRDPHAHS